MSDEYSALTGVATFWSRDDVCAGLEIDGRCPSAPGEVLMLASDAERAGAKLGRPLEMNVFEPAQLRGTLPRSPLPTVAVVGTYATPVADDRWTYPQRLRSTSERTQPNGDFNPYQPAPLLTTHETVDSLGAQARRVQVDTPLDVPADVTPADLADAVSTATNLEGTDEVDGGTLEGVPASNSLERFERDVRAQQATAQKSIAPAVLSLVLVALALLMRLLMAASEIRVPELALASLRGVSSRRLWMLGLAEPLVVLATAVPLGVGFGVGLSAVLTRQWLVPGLPLPLPWISWAAAALVLVAAIAVACVAVGMVVRDTPASQLSGVRRPQASRRWSVVAQLTTVALALAVLISKLSASGQKAPDLTDMLLPVLLAVVAGPAATRLIASAATWWTKRRALTKSLGGFVSARDLAATGGHAGDPAGDRSHRGRGVRCRCLRLGGDVARQRGRHRLAGRHHPVVVAVAARDARPHARDRPRGRVADGGRVRAQPRRELRRRRRVAPGGRDHPAGDVESRPHGRAGRRRHHAARRHTRARRQTTVHHRRQPGRRRRAPSASRRGSAASGACPSAATSGRSPPARARRASLSRRPAASAARWRASRWVAAPVRRWRWPAPRGCCPSRWTEWSWTTRSPVPRGRPPPAARHRRRSPTSTAPATPSTSPSTRPRAPRWHD
ncbi:FtsX-like permease family protein [Nocardioides sp. B-3]|uniref:FtsX-like permease family protein n=1 Tax=Nocardioides sp. B-3 TaxID=2895565 RepID=UPI0021533A29|nr:FtsX-like permease family protein [Nocardioides sp. B-3]UUZ61201.1 hypothetical protein LP418_11645 [Nocardioides sp. B-3]